MEEIKKSRGLIQRLKKNDLGFKIIIGIVFLICLATFFHSKQVRVASLELNSYSFKYILAETDFEFPDEEKTRYERYDKISKIKSIYFIDEKKVKKVRAQFEKYLIDHPQLSASMNYENFVDQGALFENILKARFSDASTIKQLNKNDIDISNYFAIKIPENKDLILSKEDLSIFATKLTAELKKESDENINLISSFFEKVELSLRVDYFTQSKITKIIEKKIPLQYTHVNAGELIIAKNERATSKHIAMLQALKTSLAKKRNLFEPLNVLGNVMFSFIFLILMIIYLIIEQPEIFKSLKHLSLICTIIILTFLFTKVMELVILKSSGGFLEIIQYPITVPFAAFLFCILFNMRLALFFSFILSIIIGFVLSMNPPYAVLIGNVFLSIIVVFSSRNMRKRTEVFEVCAKCMLGMVLFIVAANFAKGKLYNLSMVTDLTSSLIYLLIIAIMVVGLLPVLETVFDVLTDITLMEYMDPNNELLRRITLEVPGSYQHSLVLGNLSEAAAQKIDANALFCRVATLYHDIGKLCNPNYYIENQGSGINIHQLLTPVESAQVIISHITDGEILAKKYRLPKKIIDIIEQHHGTTIVYYFYRKELELHQSGASDVDEKLFRYPGPKPKSKEAAIIMIADATEAASRSLEGACEESFINLVNKIVKDKADDGQFYDCLLTFKELEIVKKSFINTLMLTRHVRIKYPETSYTTKNNLIKKTR